MAKVYDGIDADMAAWIERQPVFFVGDVDDESRQLVRITEECMWKGIEAVKPGRPISDIGRAIEEHAKVHKLGVVRAFIGHGIGETFHSGLYVPHYDQPDLDFVMEPGMTFTIEPMITLGTHEWDMWADGWTVVTKDRSWTAQFEHTLVVTDSGAEILTLP